MNKQIIIISIALVFAAAGINIVSAATPDTNEKGKIEAKFNHPQKPQPPFDKLKCPNSDNFDVPPASFKHPTKEEMEAKRAEIDKRLKLTDKQKKQIELNKQQDREKIKPIIDEIHAKKKEFREIIENDNLTPAEKDKKLKEVKDSMKELKTQADTLRKENMDNFENILTAKQKKEFEKIKEEQKKEMEQRKKEFEKIKEEQRKEMEQRKKEVIPPQKK